MSRRWALRSVLVASVAGPLVGGLLVGGFLVDGRALAGPARIERSPAVVARVNAAIDRGTTWLTKAQASDGSFREFPNFPGATTALAYCTLRACGVPRDDRSAKAAWSSLRQTYRQQDLRTYSAALYLMAIAEHGEPATGAQDERDVKLGKDDAKWAEEIVRFLLDAQDGFGRWGYLGAARSVSRDEALPTGWDNSNTQYALLGLKSAARCGIAIDPVVWRRALTHLVDAQDATGPETPRGTGPIAAGATGARILDHARGWNYRSRRDGSDDKPPYAAMTAGGVSSIVICRSELVGTREMPAKLDNDSERAAWDGLAWLGTNWMPDALLTPAPENAPDVREALGSGLSLYEFYGVERAGVLAGVEWMGPIDWYGAGAASLLGNQLPDGSWKGLDAGLMGSDPGARKRAFHVIDTCFALLFLKKGTVPVSRGAVTQGGDEADINFAAASKLPARDFEDFLDLVFARWRRAPSDDVRKRLFDGAASVGPRIVEPLLVRMDSAETARRESAHALLRRATGLDFGYDAGASSDARDAAVVQWQMWWMGAKDRVVYDPTARRLVVR